MEHLVALSGGKDSTAMALRLAEIEPHDYTFFCTPTGDELPEMNAHWDHLEMLLGAPILRLKDDVNSNIYTLIDSMKMLPNWRARWCTRILKIEIAQEFYEEHKPATVYVGLRADEPKRQGNKLYDDNVTQRFPMREWGWGVGDVWIYLEKRGVRIPRRTDCAMCFYQRIDEWWTLWKEYPGRFQKLIDMETRIGHTLLSPGKWENWPNALVDLRATFESGKVPKRILKGGGEKDCRACTL